MAKRIVSLVPSITELLFDLGLREEVVGITKFCIHPAEWFRTKTRIGGTKQIDLAKIIALEPDLVLANKEENVREQVEELQKRFPVYVSDIKNVREALDMIRKVGELTDASLQAAQIIADIKASFNRNRHANDRPARSVCYLIWSSPMMSVGGDTFINSMIEQAGYRNVLKEKERYPVVTEEELRTLAPDLIFLSSEPFPFSAKHQEDWQQRFPASMVVLVDGEMFSWYGSRMKLAGDYFLKLQEVISAGKRVNSK